MNGTSVLVFHSVKRSHIGTTELNLLSSHTDTHTHHHHDFDPDSPLSATVFCFGKKAPIGANRCSFSRAVEEG